MSAAAAVVTIRDPGLAPAVLERIAGALAARVDLPVDRLLDAQIVLEAVAAGAARRGAAGLTVRFDAAPGTVAIRVGPLADGMAAAVLTDGAVPGVGPVVERMVDGWSIDRDGDGEHLRLVLGAPAGDAAA